ncbi:ribose-phosphate diphosphokinase [Burkholderia multivorans]|uniref:ribose-phosphate diphosphokinase n=1 Tax=Burkholderia multivorans TaxID=87883 RepID=UPI001C20F749|nr:ribose-phosphate diphosphokinase [Burkholderia multivorans]MBU9200177.1 ribose-phosphate diphosphokinase [Burkholderia multivorans]MDN8078701.1 ribose-phosphate diphosphokinase [Burkholderia multivorans]
MNHIAITSISEVNGRRLNKYDAIEFFSFPGGERHARLPVGIQPPRDALGRYQPPREWVIEARVYTPADIMDLMLVTDALRRIIPAGSVLRLVMPYVPYARQDRVAVEGEPLSAAVFCNLINALAFDEVEVWDPHSDVTPALLKNVRIRSTRELLRTTFSEKGCSNLLRDCAFVAPDAGARKRVSALAAAFDTEVVFADKKRDPVTGKLSGAHVQGDVPARPLLVVDDICDGGGTFIELARVLREKTSQPLYLYVTHGLFTKGLEPLKACYAGVFSANCRDTEIASQLGAFDRSLKVVDVVGSVVA